MTIKSDLYTNAKNIINRYNKCKCKNIKRYKTLINKEFHKKQFYIIFRFERTFAVKQENVDKTFK